MSLTKPTDFGQQRRVNMTASGLVKEMRGIMATLDRILNSDGGRAMGFVLLTFTPGGGDCTLVSNANGREEIASIFKELLAEWSAD